MVASLVLSIEADQERARGRALVRDRAEVIEHGAEDTGRG